MDPIEKSFRQAFEDYELQPDNSLWEKVQAKQNKKTFRPGLLLSFVAVAASILFLVAFWFIIDARHSDLQNTVQTELAEQSPSDNSIEEEPTISASQANDPSYTVNSRDQQMTRPTVNKKTLVTFTKTTTSDIAEADNRMAENIASDAKLDDQNLPIEDIVIEPITGSEVAEQTISDETNQNLESNLNRESVRKAPTLSKPVVPPSQLNMIASSITSLMLNKELTFPERIVASLEQNKPRFFQNLADFRDRNTEIEIIW